MNRMSAARRAPVAVSCAPDAERMFPADKSATDQAPTVGERAVFAVRARFTRLIRRTLSWPAHRLDAQDARAYNRGWTVTSGKFGSRTYRDPRWDHVEELRAEHLRDEAATGSRPDLAPAQRDARAVLR